MRSFSTRRTFTALAAFALCAASPLIVTAAASPAAAKAAAPKLSVTTACPTPGKGVTEVVDFTKLGGKVKVACDPTDPKTSTGLTVLKAAGFTYSFVPNYPGFVCRIDGLPNPCNGAPATAYWSYWHAKPHGTWIFSNKGAGSYHPLPGSVQGWAFGAGTPPRISPP
jgi:hypothetical protein